MFRFAPIRDKRFKKTILKSHRLAVDNFDAQPFNRNDAGWIRNTISELARCTSKSQYDAVAQRLVEMAGKGDVNPDLTVEEQFAMIKPRYAQSATEINTYLEMTNSLVTGRIEEAYKKSVSKKEKTVEPAPNVETKSPEVSE